MATGLIEIMKRASLDAMDANQMCDLRFGTVVSSSPLKVQITNQFTIPESLLIVPKGLTDYTVSVSMDWTTESVPSHSHSYSGNTGSETAGTNHTHSYSGTTGEAGSHSHKLVGSKDKTITIHNALQVGDKVALLRKTGGQSYYILDRI